MRAIPDRKLPSPYASWIDRAAPLPPTVTLLPRTIDLETDALAFFGLGGMFGVMGALFLLLPPWRYDPARDSWVPFAIIGAVCLALWSVPLILLRRLIVTFRAHADMKRERLRQGVLVGPEGILVRMEANRCHPIARGRFVVARRFPPERSRDGRKPTLIVETLDGTVEFFADRLAAKAEAINTAVRELWPAWSRPKRLMRADRRKLADRQTERNVVRAGYFFAGAMVVFCIGFGGVITVGQDAPAADSFSLVLFVGLVLTAGATVNLLVRYFRLRLAYRCPECRKRPTRVHDALPAIHFYCKECNVEWDTGLQEFARK